MKENLRPAAPWQPGQSGNPSGRSSAAFRATQAARAKVNIYRQWLEGIARGSPKDADRVNAIKVLITIASGEALRVKLSDVDAELDKLDVDKALTAVAKSRHLKLVPMTPDEINEEGDHVEEKPQD